MHYPAAINYLYSFLNFETTTFRYKRELNIKRMATLLDWFGHPEKQFSPILVAGTNGKGSTANFLSSILNTNRLKTGLYTSPHLSNTRERIRVGGKVISESDFSELMTAIRYVVEEKKKSISYLGPITFFELFTLLAVLYFAKKGVAHGIFEVGMGGRLDATNAMNPVLSIITPIGMDHTEHLGNKLAKIAHEKAAIIHPRGDVILSRQRSEAKAEMRKALKRQKAKGYFFGSSYRVTHEHLSKSGSFFDFRMNGLRLKRAHIRLPGEFQVENAAEALAAARVLETKQNLALEESKIRKGLRDAFWPGRFEILKRKGRTVVLDGAHNEASVRELSETLGRLFRKEKKILILGTSREKNLRHILAPLAKLGDYFVVTKSKNTRAQEPRAILETLGDLAVKKPSFWAPHIREAFDVVDSLPSRNSITIVAGSLFLVAEARERIKCRKFV